MRKRLFIVVACAAIGQQAVTPARGQEAVPDATGAVPEVFPSFTIPAVREEWFGFKAEVDAEKGLLARLIPEYREELDESGVNVYGWYMMSFQGNPVGGLQQKFAATGLNDFGLDFDLEKLCGLEDLSVRISGSRTWGPNLTDAVGAFIPVNAVYSGTAWRFFEMYFEKWLLDETVSIRAGRLSIGWEYGLDYDFFTQYLSAAYRLNVGALGINSPNFSVIPYANWGVRFKWQPNDNWQFKASFMNGYPRNFADPQYGGLQFDFRPGQGAFWIGEGVYRWEANAAQRRASGRLPGQLKVGAYTDTGRFNYVDGTSRQHSGLSDVYGIFRQKLWEPESVSHRGVHFWTALSYSGNENVVSFPYYWSGGLVWQGPMEVHSEDTLAFGFARGWFSRFLPNQSSETVLEWDYNWYVNDVLTVTPNLQYIVNPGGTGKVNNALVVGLLTYVTF